MNDVLLPTGRPALMGILNVTPDSFSDGGQHATLDAAIRHAEAMVEQGADIIDVGGESTRPGADDVPEAVEIDRVAQVVSELTKRGHCVSIDTMKTQVARHALDAGATIVNDVNGLRAPGMLETCSQHQCTVCIMHMQGQPRTMQQSTTYPRGVLPEVIEFLSERATAAIEAGTSPERIWVDPGIGFGKTTNQNLQLIHGIPDLSALGFPVLIGVSRKSFIGRVLGSETAPLGVEDRLEGTLAIQVIAQLLGARIIRAHDVQAAKRAIQVAAAYSNLQADVSQ